MSTTIRKINDKTYRLITNAEKRDILTFTEAAKLVNLQHWHIDKAYDYAGNLMPEDIGFYVENEFYESQDKEIELWWKAVHMIGLELCKVLEERGYKADLMEVYLGMPIPAKKEG